MNRTELIKMVEKEALIENQYETSAYEYGNYPGQENFIKGAQLIIDGPYAEAEKNLAMLYESHIALSMKCDIAEKKLAEARAENKKLIECCLLLADAASEHCLDGIPKNIWDRVNLVLDEIERKK